MKNNLSVFKLYMCLSYYYYFLRFTILSYFFSNTLHDISHVKLVFKQSFPRLTYSLNL